MVGATPPAPELSQAMRRMTAVLTAAAPGVTVSVVPAVVDVAEPPRVMDRVIADLYALPSVIVNELTATASPAVIDVVFIDISAGMEPSITQVLPSPRKSRYQVAVPVALADEAEVMALRVMVAVPVVPANTVLHRSSARRVVTVPPLAGRVPA